MLQPPVTQTPVLGLHEVSKTPMVTTSLQTAFVNQTTHLPQITANRTKVPTDSPTPIPTPTPKPTSTPYFTPAWCPVKTVTPIVSGKLRVAYASQSGLWLWDEEGTDKQLNKSADIQQVILSDDGQIIAFTRLLDENHVELWAINADGSNERRLVSAVEFTQLDSSMDALGVIPELLQWEPGSHHLIFFTYPIYHALWIYEPTIPWLVDVDTGEISAAPYHDGNIIYAPNGKHVVIFNSVGMNLARIDGSDLREDILPDYHGFGMGESIYNPIPFWSNDASSLQVALPDQDDIYSNKATVTVWRVPVEGMPKVLGQWSAFGPSVHFSPDLATMAYWPWPEGTANQRELHLARLDGKTTKNAADTIYIRGEMIDFLAWSPDSQYFIFSMGDPGLQARLYLGHICQRPKPIFENPSGGIATWVDASRFLLEIHEPVVTDSWKLHLGKIDQKQTKLLGIVTAYDWSILP